MRSKTIFALSIACAVTLTISMLPRVAAADEFAVAPAPSNVQAKLTSGGVQVSWDPAPAAQPKVTHYVVHAGQNSCPVLVPAGARTASMPIVEGQRRIVPRVQAVNAYGFSEPVKASASLAVKPPVSSRFRSVQFLQFSDFHGAIEATNTNAGAARLATAFERDRRAVKPTFTVSAGDNIGGAPVISSEFDEVPTIKALNAMKLDVSTLGNHEHDRPIPFLRQRIDDSKFAYVVSNYSTLKPLQGKKNGVKRFNLIERDGITVGFVGMNTPDVASLVKGGNLSFGKGAKNTIELSESTRSVQRDIENAKRAGAQMVVVLAHQGWAENANGEAKGPLIDMARKLQGAAVVYGGHTHLQYASIINQASVVEVENAGREYSRTQVCLDTQANRVLGSHVEFIQASSIAQLPPNPKVAAFVARYQQQLAAKLDVRAGSVADVISNGDGSRSDQTEFGTLLSDAARVEYGTDFALLNIGGIRSNLPAASYRPADPTLRRPSQGSSGPYDVTLGDVLTALPFENFLATTTISGEQLWKALENGVSVYPGSGRLPQVSGLRFAFDPTAPLGSRVQSVTRDDGAPILPDNTIYTITAVDFMISGGDGYGDLFNPQQAHIRDLMTEVLVQALRADGAAGRVTSVPDPSGRISITSK
jgi:2',3'-cyclic-nucleotide 2'-phosphodiesterase (5'-nucleotidase family)